MRLPNLPKIKTSEIVNYLMANKAFDAETCWAIADEEETGHTTYSVYSYGVLIARHANGAIVFFNPTKYSKTTSKHQNFVARAWGLSGKAINKQDTTN